jgi:hypothetical protein
VDVLRAYFKIFWHFPEGTDENHEKYVCMYVQVQISIRKC